MDMQIPPLGHSSSPSGDHFGDYHEGPIKAGDVLPSAIGDPENGSGTLAHNILDYAAAIAALAAIKNLNPEI